MSATEPDDGWADLYRELGVESGPAAKPAPAAHAPEPPADELDEEVGTVAEVGDEDDSDAGYADADEAVLNDDGTEQDAGDGDEMSEAEEAGVVAEGGPGEGEGEPGGPRKRRRRRRRRKKGGAEGGEEAPAEGAAVAEGDDAAEAEPADDGDDRPAPESGRELIATWNVPSWEQIVAGLYRPDR